MKSSQELQWMQLPLASTRLSQPFRETAALHGFKTLGQLLSLKLTNLLEMHWFTLPMIEEIAFIVKSLRRKDEPDAKE